MAVEVVFPTPPLLFMTDIIILILNLSFAFHVEGNWVPFLVLSLSGGTQFPFRGFHCLRGTQFPSSLENLRLASAIIFFWVRLSQLFVNVNREVVLVWIGLFRGLTLFQCISGCLGAAFLGCSKDC